MPTRTHTIEWFSWNRVRRDLICWRCSRRITFGDYVRIETFWDRDGAFTAHTHVDCFDSDILRRPRERAPAPAFVQIEEGRPRRLMMEATTKQPAAEKKTKRTAKKAQREDGRASLAETVGARLQEIGKGVSGVATVAKALASGKTVSHAQLAKLRDAINEEASRRREKDDAKGAVALSSVNRLVRRLERAARKGGAKKAKKTAKKTAKRRTKRAKK